MNKAYLKKLRRTVTRLQSIRDALRFKLNPTTRDRTLSKEQLDEMYQEEIRLSLEIVNLKEALDGVRKRNMVYGKS